MVNSSILLRAASQFLKLSQEVAPDEGAVRAAIEGHLKTKNLEMKFFRLLPSTKTALITVDVPSNFSDFTPQALNTELAAVILPVAPGYKVETTFTKEASALRKNFQRFHKLSQVTPSLEDSLRAVIQSHLASKSLSLINLSVLPSIKSVEISVGASSDSKETTQSLNASLTPVVVGVAPGFTPKVMIQRTSPPAKPAAPPKSGPSIRQPGSFERGENPETPPVSEEF
jgi:hypothetical protein